MSSVFHVLEEADPTENEVIRSFVIRYRYSVQFVRYSPANARYDEAVPKIYSQT